MSRRWERMVERFAEQERYCLGSDILYREDVAKLLARQQARVVRMVKKIGREATTSQFGTSNEAMAYKMACADILAALRAEGKGRER